MEYKEYLIAEYTDRRSDIARRIKIIEDDMKHGLIFSGAIWAWIIVNASNEHAKYVIVLPFYIALFLSYKSYVQDKAIKNISSYIKKLEDEFKLPQHLGWERNVTVKNEHATPELKKHTFMFWVLLVIFNVIAAIVFMTKIKA